MDIAVLGGGNGSYAAAVDMTSQGHNVRLWRRDAAAANELRRRGNHLVMKDFAGSHDIRLAMVSGDIGDAIDGAELIVCPAPATAQSDIARGLAPRCGA